MAIQKIFATHRLSVVWRNYDTNTLVGARQCRAPERKYVY